MRLEDVMRGCISACRQYGGVYTEIMRHYGKDKEVGGSSLYDAVESIRAYPFVVYSDERQIAVGEAAYQLSPPVSHAAAPLMSSTDTSVGGGEKMVCTSELNKKLSAFLAINGKIMEHTTSGVYSYSRANSEIRPYKKGWGG